ncbi:MAG: trimethylamine methyltransferase family protein [Candidatus Thorarchaeota archaeon]
MITIQFLTDDDLESIHESTLRVLKETGVRISNDAAQNLLLETGCTPDSDIFRFPSSLVEECLEKVPSNFRMFNYDGKVTWEVGADRVIFNPASSALNFKDRGTQEIRKGTISDVVELIQLVESLRHIEFQSTALVPFDVPEPIAEHYRLYLTLMNSTKPIVTGAFSKNGILEMKHLLEALMPGPDELAQKPRSIFDCCPTSPLTWGDTACQNLLDCAAAGIPAAIVPAPLSGATSPVTIHGTLVQTNAEILAGVVISQLRNPGSPIIYGGAPGSFDMKYATPRFGAIEAMVTSCASAELGKHYGIPTHSYIGSSDSKMVDAQSGFESGFGMILGALSRINIISGPGMLAHLNCQSLEKLVIDNEICGSAYRLIKGFDIDSVEIVTDLISKVGSDGNYLRQKHTSKKLRSEHFMPSAVIDRLSIENWIESGSKTLLSRTSEIVTQHLNEDQHFRLPDEEEKLLKIQLKEIASQHGVSVDKFTN